VLHQHLRHLKSLNQPQRRNRASSVCGVLLKARVLQARVRWEVCSRGQLVLITSSSHTTLNTRRRVWVKQYRHGTLLRSPTGTHLNSAGRLRQPKTGHRNKMVDSSMHIRPSSTRTTLALNPTYTSHKYRSMKPKTPARKLMECQPLVWRRSRYL
jgi:hypothetical protein